MILLLSKKNLEGSTEDIIDWLEKLNGNFIRLNGNDFCKNSYYLDGKFHIENIDYNKINIIWNRRWFEGNFVHKLISNIELQKESVLEIHTSMNKELGILSKSFFQSLDSKKWLSHPREISYNKIEVLQKAKEFNLLVPEMIICTRKKDLIVFKNKYNRIVSKAITDPVSFLERSNTKMNTYNSRTIEITNSILNRTPNTFFPSLFQKLIYKEYEIRAFFLGGEFYSMAIFSQLDSQTSVDFRNYNHKKPNRTIRYKMPNELKNKLRKLISFFNFTTGSIDLIKDKDGRYIFLEVNPVGQFGMTSIPCNYNLEKLIAEYLIYEDKKRSPDA